MSDNIQDIVLRSFFTDEEYMRRVVPFMEPEYFEGDLKNIFKSFVKYVAKYNSAPTLESFKVTAKEEGLSQEQYDLLPTLFEPVDAEFAWLIDKTEKWVGG